jgi:benzoyl-CoA 2,3-dioxygenase component B
VPTGVVHGSEWARYHRMRPSDYTWGLFTVPIDRGHIVFGEQRGARAWTGVPAEYRALLLEHVCVQADVENAAIEQSCTLTRTAPSRQDLQNLFQFFLEEGRHTWAMVHLLLEHFGPEGEVQADALLTRMSGDTENPRLLEAFNHHTDDWLSHFMWCLLADRVGKYQIHAVTQSAFLPLACSARFMMLEEPLHISFGLAGLERVLLRSAEVTLRADRYDIFEAGAIPLPVIQKYLNYWASKIYDLFGHDTSSRSHELYRSGIRAPRNFAATATAEILVDRREAERVVQVPVQCERATNAVMRRQYIAELQRVLDRWNQQLARCALDFELRQPHERFHRTFGPCHGLPFDVDGELIAVDAETHIAARLPSRADLAGVQSLMRRELGKDSCASWIAPPGSRLEQLAEVV